MTIDRTKLEPLVRDDRNKRTPAISIAYLMKELKMFILDLYSELKTLSVYDLAQWLLCSSNWISNYKSTNRRPYSRGDIILVNLGSSNFGFEASYEHPCVVLFNGPDFIIVVPGSTGKYKKNSGFIFNCIQGFRNPTGIQLDQIRYISKSRVTSGVLGNVGPTTLNYMNDFILINYCGTKDFEIQKTLSDLINTHREQLANKDKEIEDLKNRLDQLETKFIGLKSGKLKLEGSVRN